ncbi:MAG: diacylglycerol kinase family lipid kinase [Thermoleophilaceae bacterium]|nr:diacylglycerol kinase family lipid kinase [Thermoleophilaceae bacterium]
MPDRSLALIANPVAGGGQGRRALDAASAELGRRGARFRALTTPSARHAMELAREVAGGGEETVVAVGGDGHVGLLAGVLRETDTTLAIVPAGRGNDLARVLGIPTDPAAAARLALDGEARPVDVGEVDGVPFLGIASLGFDSDANRIANESRLRGNAVYLYAALRALGGWRHARFEVTVDGELHVFSGYTVAVANSKAYGGGMMLVPHAVLDDRRLDVLMVHEHSRLRWLAMLPRVFRGTHVGDPRAEFSTGQVIEVRADRPFTVYADGEPIGELPVTVRVGERQIRIVAPVAGPAR